MDYSISHQSPARCDTSKALAIASGSVSWRIGNNILLPKASLPTYQDAMAMTSFGGGQDNNMGPVWNPTRDVAHGASRGGRDMRLDVMEVA